MPSLASPEIWCYIVYQDNILYLIIFLILITGLLDRVLKYCKENYLLITPGSQRVDKGFKKLIFSSLPCLAILLFPHQGRKPTIKHKHD